MIIIVGAVIFAVGVLLVLRHIHVWRQATDSAKDQIERGMLRSQVKRRCLTSTGIAVLGIIYASFAWAKDPISFSFLVMATLIITVLIFFMAGIDLMATFHMLQRDKHFSQKAKIELLREYDRQKKKLQDAEAEE